MFHHSELLFFSKASLWRKRNLKEHLANTTQHLQRPGEGCRTLSAILHTIPNLWECWIFWKAGMPFKGPLVNWKSGSNSYQMHEDQVFQKPSPGTCTGTQCKSAEKDSRACKAEILHKSAAHPCSHKLWYYWAVLTRTSQWVKRSNYSAQCLWGHIWNTLLSFEHLISWKGWMCWRKGRRMPLSQAGTWGVTESSTWSQ